MHHVACTCKFVEKTLYPCTKSTKIVFSRLVGPAAYYIRIVCIYIYQSRGVCMSKRAPLRTRAGTFGVHIPYSPYPPHFTLFPLAHGWLAPNVSSPVPPHRTHAPVGARVLCLVRFASSVLVPHSHAAYLYHL